MPQPDWVCVQCSTKLGTIIGGELRAEVPSGHCLTRGPHLVVTCPDCGAEKTFYTSDQVVRATYQLIDALSSEFAKRMVKIVGSRLQEIQNFEQRNASED